MMHYYQIYFDEYPSFFITGFIMFFQFGILRIATIIINGEVKSRIRRADSERYCRIFGKIDNISDEPTFLSYSDFIPYIKLYFFCIRSKAKPIIGNRYVMIYRLFLSFYYLSSWFVVFFLYGELYYFAWWRHAN